MFSAAASGTHTLHRVKALRGKRFILAGAVNNSAQSATLAFRWRRLDEKLP